VRLWPARKNGLKVEGEGNDASHERRRIIVCVANSFFVKGNRGRFGEGQSSASKERKKDS